MAKIAGQPSVCVRMPPSSAPDEAPRPPIAPHAPRPRLRSGPSGSEEVMIDSVAGETTAPPNPCSARAPISSPRESASAQASEENANSAVPGDEHAPASEQVGGAAAEHQEAGERDRVGVDDPLQAGGREVQAVAHRRQRHVDDGDVEDDHELGQADDEQQRVRRVTGREFEGVLIAFTMISVRSCLSRYKRGVYPGSRYDTHSCSDV